MPHIHASFVDAVITAAFVVIFGAAWRSVTGNLAARESPIADAMAFIY